MSPLKAILEESIHADADLESLLRKARVAGEMLNIPELVEWSKWELNGYPENVHVPSYRQLPFSLTAESWTPAGPVRFDLPKHCFLKRSDDEEAVQEIKNILGAEKWDFRSPIAQIKGWIASHKEGVYFPLDGFLPAMPDIFKQCVSQPYRATIQRLYARFDITSFKTLISRATNNLLEMALALQRNVPELFKDLELSTQEVDNAKVRDIIHIYINVSQHVDNIFQNSNSIIEELHNLGLNPEDLAKLREILQQKDKRGIFKWLYDIAGTLTEYTLTLVVRTILRHLFPNEF